VASGQHGEIANLKLDKVGHLASGEVDLDGVVHTDVGVGEADGAAVVGRDEGDSTHANLEAANTAQFVLKKEKELLIKVFVLLFVLNEMKKERNKREINQKYLGLISTNVVDGVSSLGVIEESVVLVGCLDGNDVHESSGESGVSSDLAVDLDESLLDDHGDLTSSECVFESVAQQDHHGEALTQFVGAS
jgi:hypothetical protein